MRTVTPSRRVQVFIVLLATACLVVGAGLAALQGWGTPAWWAGPTVAFAVLATETAVVHLQYGRQRRTFSLTEAVIAGALVLASGAWAVVWVGIGMLAAQLVRRQPRIKTYFNTGQFVVEVAAALSVVGLVGWDLKGAAAGMLTFWLLNQVLMGTVLSLTTDASLSELLTDNVLLRLLHTVGNTAVGLLAAYLLVEAPIGLVGLVVPMILLWVSYDQEARRAAEARLFAELARGQELAAGQSADLSATVVVTAAARLFGGADVEMLVLSPEGPVRYEGDELKPPRRTRARSDAFSADWVTEAFGHRGVSSGVVDDRPYCCAVLGPEEDPVAVLVARRGSGMAAYGRRETRLFEVLVRQAESWLSAGDLSDRYQKAVGRADRATSSALALSDLGAATTPSLGLLRDSAGRLARLADGGGVEDIVEQLQTVERAVASLLGAVALAADPQVVAASDGATPSGELPPVTRPSSDWTTTGVLR